MRQRKSPLRLDRANVVGVAESPAALQLARALPSGALDAIEVRLDAFRAAPDLRAFGVPILATVRSPDEGGRNRLNPRERASRYLAVLDHAEAIDVELASRTALASVLDAARDTRRRIVLSFHDFSGTPSAAALRAMQRRAAALGADVFKAAVTPRTPGELLALLALLDDPPLPTAVMGMGAFGKISRLAAAACGSVLNYGWIERPNVAGQWSAVELRARLDELGA
ncbi:MAG: type I 3-dehydroquinate dehydratase [Terrimicrobiaceae bacterium]|nr:type I 3-dehydroquinate dehydratase [Terrimicrobiaceae bacterium]